MRKYLFRHSCMRYVNAPISKAFIDLVNKNIIFKIPQIMLIKTKLVTKSVHDIWIDGKGIPLLNGR